MLRELTVKLQSKAIDVASAYKVLVHKVVSRLKTLRTNSSSEFNKQFRESTKISKQLHGDQFELTIPRLSGRQRHRSNPPSSTPEEYYRTTLYNEFLSRCVRVGGENPSLNVTVGLFYLLPSECIKLGDDVLVPDDLDKVVDLFKGDLPHSVMFNTEYISWMHEWKQHAILSEDVPDTLIGALKECNSLTYPNLNVLLSLALVLPVTSCESERSFSQY